MYFKDKNKEIKAQNSPFLKKKIWKLSGSAFLIRNVYFLQKKLSYYRAKAPTADLFIVLSLICVTLVFKTQKLVSVLRNGPFPDQKPAERAHAAGSHSQ